MKTEETYNDQAESLRQKIDSSKRESKALPSRSELHKNKKNKTKWKLKYPVIRLLVLFFTLLPLVIFSAYSALSDKKFINSASVNEKSGYEEINIKQHDEEEHTNTTNNKEQVDEKVIEVEENPSKDTSVDLSDEHPTKLPSTDKDHSTHKKKEQTNKKEAIDYHTVQPNETLFRIAMKYYNSQSGIEIIKEANNINGNEIQTGQVLIIPQ